MILDLDYDYDIRFECDIQQRTKLESSSSKMAYKSKKNHI